MWIGVIAAACFAWLFDSTDVSSSPFFLLNLSSSSFFSVAQLLFAVSPLLVLAYILISAFESEEQEDRKRNKKSDFNLEGHSE